MNTRNRKYNYHSRKQFSNRSIKLANELDKFIDVSLQQHHINKLIDYDAIHKVVDHLKELSELLKQPE